MPPLALTCLKYASIPCGISLYPGAAGPVSGKWPPTVTSLSGTPGAAAPPPSSDEPHAPTPRASAAVTHVAAIRTFIAPAPPHVALARDALAVAPNPDLRTRRAARRASRR